MANPIIRIHDISTNEVVDREMTDTEHAKWLSEKAEQKIAADTQAATAAAKTSAQTKLAALGLTADEIAAL